MSSEDIAIKQPIKRLEIPINKFNDVAIPHHLDLLKKHKNNIKKYQAAQDWERVYVEQISASRIVKQLKQLLYEMDTLRNQVMDCDIATFDKLTMKSKTNTLNGIKEYTELELNLPLVERQPTASENQSQQQMQLDNRYMQVQAEQEDLERQQACLEAWNALQTDLQDLQTLFVDFNKMVHEQGELVNRVEDNVEETQHNVSNGLKHLQQASKYKVVAYPLVGALLGTCLGGPVGFLAGMKFGGLTAVGGGLLGLKCGKILKQKTIVESDMKQIEGPPDPNSESPSQNGTPSSMQQTGS
ncbi:hypothetical protein QAD02_005269 [Eretmocerus hayati]|uniref:Uncharacterized protein n=1 Tax=Eretmocerus hayati TaxID=131215 RepID=A0ACC2NUV2_9HYME|nr:hypothetical protein QAD02_005269 [Eretmocerus hayati]